MSNKLAPVSADSSTGAGPATAAMRFRTTHWSVVLKARADDEAAAREALASLCSAYWYPLYAFVRRQGLDSHTAEDVTQEFFARLLETDFLADLSPERGRLRSFFLAALKHFLANERRAWRALKRGGGRQPVTWNGESPEARYAQEPVNSRTPEMLFEHRWAWTLLEHVLERLEQEYRDANKADLFEELKPFLSEKKAGSRDSIATRHGVSVGAVDVAIHRLRQRYGALLREEITRTVSRPEEVEDEIRHLIAIVGQ